MDGATKHVTRRRAVAGGVAVVVGASVAAWAVAHPQAALAATVVRALADCAAVVTLGLSAVPMLDAGRHRDELTRTARRSACGGGRRMAVRRAVPTGRGRGRGRRGPRGSCRPRHDGGVRIGHRGGALRAVQRRGGDPGAAGRDCSGRKPQPAAVAAFGIAALGLAARTIERPHVGELGRRYRHRRACAGRGAVVRHAGGAGVDRRPPRAVGPGAAPVLRTVAAGA